MKFAIWIVHRFFSNKIRKYQRHKFKIHVAYTRWHEEQISERNEHVQNGLNGSSGRLPEKPSGSLDWPTT